MQTVFPVLRILDYAVAKAFYVGGFGFSIDWEWRHEPGFPVFMGLSKGDLSFCLSEHSGDCEVGGLVMFYVEDVDLWYREALARGIEPERPPEDQLWGVRDVIYVDPFGNRLVVNTRIEEG